MRNALLILGAIGVLLLLAGVGWGWRYYTASIEGRVGASEKIQSAPNRISAYDHFFNLCAGIRADEVSLDAQNDLLQVTSDTFQRTRVQTNIVGLIGHRASLIEEYNANARKDYTVGQFRDSNLPYQLQVNSYEKGYRTSCGN